MIIWFILEHETDNLVDFGTWAFFFLFSFLGVLVICYVSLARAIILCA